MMPSNGIAANLMEPDAAQRSVRTDSSRIKVERAPDRPAHAIEREDTDAIGQEFENMLKRVAGLRDSEGYADDFARQVAEANRHAAANQRITEYDLRVPDEQQRSGERRAFSRQDPSRASAVAIQRGELGKGELGHLYRPLSAAGNGPRGEVVAGSSSNEDLANSRGPPRQSADAGGAPLYTRDGAFALDANSQLVSRDGLLVQAFVADTNGEVDSSGAVGSVTIPLGALTLARATSEVSVGGNLNAASSVATAGAVVTSDALITGTGVATAGTALTNLIDAQGNALFADGDLVTLSGATKGGFALPGEEQFTIGTNGTTVQDFMTFLEGALAIHTDPALGENAGVTLDAAGQMVIAGNFGESNALEIEAGNLVNTTQGTVPLAFTQTSAAAGEGLTMQLDLFDSLGGPVSARLRLALESKSDAGTTWRFYAESVDDSDVSNVLGTGTISFDPNGQFIGATGNELSIDHANSGAASPLAFTVDFAAATGLNDGTGSSTFTQLAQDGLPEGTLQDFAVDEEGFIIGTFSNAHQQVLGQVALATFVNPHGLKLATDNNYVVTANSGDANITAPKESNAGRIKPGSLELSNVDLAREFIGLINASTGFLASSRVITTADELLQELLLIAR